jgi:thioredoxin-related protein
LSIIVGLELIIVLFLTKFVVQFLNSFRVNGVYQNKKELGKGDLAPLFRGVDQNGDPVKLADSGEKEKLILFTNSYCGTCKELYSNLNKINDLFSDWFKIILITDSWKEKKVDGIHIMESNNLHEKYDIEMVPSVVYVDRNNNVILKESIKNHEQLIQLSNSIISELSKTSA